MHFRVKALYSNLEELSLICGARDNSNINRHERLNKSFHMNESKGSIQENEYKMINF